MKKTAKRLCLLLALLFLSGCAAPRGSQTSLYDQGLETALLLSELAGNEACLELYSADSKILSIIQEAAVGDRRVPSAVYAITLPPEGLTEIPSPTSDSLKAFLQKRSISTLASQINAAAGVEALAASSICTVSKTFVSSDATNALYLYVYPDAAPVAITFLAGEDNTVSATGTFLLAPDFPTDSAEAIQSYFFDTAVSVTQITK